MAKIRFYGLCPAHSLKYGLNHKYIDKILTIGNWKKKAIVRNSKYIYVQKGRVLCKNYKKKYIYSVFINEYEETKDYKTIEEAISAANNYSNIEGSYPKPWKQGWQIHPIMKFPNISKKK